MPVHNYIIGDDSLAWFKIICTHVMRCPTGHWGSWAGVSSRSLSGGVGTVLVPCLCSCGCVFCILWFSSWELGEISLGATRRRFRCVRVQFCFCVSHPAVLFFVFVVVVATLTVQSRIQSAVSCQRVASTAAVTTRARALGRICHPYLLPSSCAGAG